VSQPLLYLLDSLAVALKSYEFWMEVKSSHYLCKTFYVTNKEERAALKEDVLLWNILLSNLLMFYVKDLHHSRSILEQNELKEYNLMQLMVCFSHLPVKQRVLSWTTNYLTYQFRITFPHAVEDFGVVLDC
jgi:hypothetical protein